MNKPHFSVSLGRKKLIIVCQCLTACGSVSYLPVVYGQKKASDLGLELTRECEPPCGCGGLDLCPLEDQPMLSTAEPSSP